MERMGILDWRKISHFPEEWSNRTRLAANLIEDGMSVIEFGAGNGIMGDILGSRNPYLPTDIIKRKDGFEVINLNHPLQLIGNFDIGVALGVMEYLEDVSFTLGMLSNNVPYLITTYCPARFKLLKCKMLRKNIGWKNTLTVNEFEERLNEAGFELVYKELIEKRFFYVQYLFKVKRRND